MIRARPHVAQLIERTHHSVRAAALDAYLERAQIQLAERLLGKPRLQARSVRFGLVDREMFDIYIHAVGNRAARGLRRHNARKQRVFAVILRVSAAERTALQVRARGIPTRNARRYPLVSYGKSERIRERRIERRRNKARHRERRPAAAVERNVFVLVVFHDVTVKPRRSVVFEQIFFAYRFY